jgi:hypothetical protein
MKRRLALTSLCDAAQEALRHHQITLAQAEALLLGGVEAQQELVSRRLGGHRSRADELRDILLDERMPVALAIFDREQYTGTCTTDLFADDANTYFDVRPVGRKEAAASGQTARLRLTFNLVTSSPCRCKPCPSGAEVKACPPVWRLVLNGLKRG